MTEHGSVLHCMVKALIVLFPDLAVVTFLILTLMRKSNLFLALLQKGRFILCSDISSTKNSVYKKDFCKFTSKFIERKLR